ncbi:hypothetical protein NpPPO83_00008908 [Neofusicoccum parvum]|uniref:Uncharacterized protein n=1 Tax=Neofusicoccum parvum TaxID=310453 RepID=A0ACB5SM66_9PEZI|nr:hypothetical protein NpPPO83_00008908 [Neofusicoccum parvum]
MPRSRSPSSDLTTGHPYTSTTPSTTPPYNAYASLGFGAHNAIRKSYLDDAVAARRRPPPPLEKRGFLAWARRLVAPRRREVEEAVPPVPDRPALLPRFAFEPRRRDDRAPVPAIPPSPFDFDLPPPSPGQTARSPPARRSFELQLPPVDSPPPPRELSHATTATLLSSFPAPPSTTTDDGAEGNDEPSLDPADHPGRLDAIREETEDNDGASSSSGPSSLELPEPTMALAAAAASRSTLSVGDATVGASSVGSGGTAETAVTEEEEEGSRDGEGDETEVEVEAEAKERRSGAVRLVPYADSDDEGACTVEVGGASFQLVAGAEDAGMEEEESVRKRTSQSRIPRPVVQEPRPKLDRATQEERLGLPINTHAAKVAQAELGLVRQPVVKKKAGGKGQPRKSVFVEMV